MVGLKLIHVSWRGTRSQQAKLANDPRGQWALYGAYTVTSVDHIDISSN